MIYLLDSNVFIEAKNRYYAFDVCPGFWEWLDDAHLAGRIHSIAKIRDELIAGADELADWVRDRDSFFLAPDAAVIASFRQVATWAVEARPEFDQGAVNVFLQGGDSYLVAHAHAHGLTVVTHEVRADTVKRIKIPNACEGVSVGYVNPFEMLRAEGARIG